MNRRWTSLLLASLAVAPIVPHAFGAPVSSPEPAYTSKRVSTPEDLAAIRQLTEDFRTAVKTRNGKMLSSLVLQSSILFTSPGDQARVEAIRQYDPGYDGVGVGGFTSFARFVSTTPDRIEEKFYNIQIEQDGHIAFVSFDYEFYENDVVSNYGIEHWQLRKLDGKWKIFSVIWTSHEPPKPAPR